MAKAGSRVGLITLKKNEDEIACRLVSIKSLVLYFRVRFARFKTGDLKKVKDGIDKMWEFMIEIMEAKKNSFSVIDSYAQWLKYEKNCDFIFVDSLDYIYMNPRNIDDTKKFDAEEIGSICDIFRQTAKEHDVLMVLERDNFEKEDGEDMEDCHLTV